MRRVFAEAVSREVLRVDAFVFEHTLGGNRNGQNRGLRNLGQLELVVRSFKAELRERVAKRSISFGEDFTRNRVVVGKLSAHSDCLRSLSRKKKSERRCVHGQRLTLITGLRWPQP